MPAYAEEAQDERLLAFIGHMERWRTLSRRHGVTDLLWDIYESPGLCKLCRRHAEWSRSPCECARLI